MTTLQKRVFEVSPYGIPVHCCFREDTRAYARRYLKLDLEHDDSADAETFLLRDGRGRAALLVSMPKSRSAECISHEAVHVVMWVFQAVDVRMDYSNQEPAAYQVGYVSKMLDSLLYKRKRRK